MKYDPEIHITHSELAALMGVTLHKLRAMVRHQDGPQSTVLTVNGESRSCYVRSKAIKWADRLMNPKQAIRGDIVPPSNWNLMNRREYKPSGLLPHNLARSAQVYPNGLRAQAQGVGNGIQSVWGRTL